MKINTSEIYIRYCSSLNQEKSFLKDELKGLQNSKDYTLNTLKEYSAFLNNFCTTAYDNLQELNLIYLNRSILQKKYENDNTLIEVETKVKRLVNVLIEIKRRTKQIETRLDEIETRLVDSKTFVTIISSFNTKIIDSILKGYVFHLGYRLSYVCIKRKDISLRKRKKIDWGTSNKNKKEIIERGGIPYEVLTRNEDGSIATDNGGEYWLAYHNKQIEYLWHWAKGRAPFANKFFYKFKPTYCGAANNGCVQKLKQLENSNSEYLKYFH